VPELSEGTKVMITTVIETLVLLTIKDSDLVMTGEITNLSASINDDIVSVGLLFENNGNVHYAPFVGAVLKNKDGQVVAELAPTQLLSSILPTYTRLCMVEMVPDGDLLPGTYTAEATVTLEDGTVLDTEETTLEI
jgi:hypothetical protein